MKPHKHAEYIKAWADGKSIESRLNEKDIWFPVPNPMWLETFQYRVRNKHQDLIDQKAARPELIVEICGVDGKWRAIEGLPIWQQTVKYRLVEPQKKKVKMWQWVVQVQESFWVSEFFHKSLEEAQSVNGGKVIQCADWTEIEVEE